MSKETILVVEDGHAVRNLVCLMLVHSGYRVMEARDGHHALRVYEAHPQSIQLVLSDLVMPNMRGVDLVAHLRRARPAVRILLMSGYIDEAMIHRLERDSVGFLAKPFTSVELVEKIRLVLDAPWAGSSIERSADA